MYHPDFTQFHELMLSLFLNDIVTFDKILLGKKINIKDCDYQIFREILSRGCHINTLKIIITNYKLDKKAMNYITKILDRKDIIKNYYFCPYITPSML